MPPCLRYSIVVSQKLALVSRNRCDILLYCKPLNGESTTTKRSQHHKTREIQIDKPNYGNNLVDLVQQRLNFINQQYERITGIAEMRQIQDKVLEAERQFVDITQKRKSCQDLIDKLKEKLNNLKDKLESTPRSSDGYLHLITSEHNLLKEQLSVEAQLEQLKEKEQLYFDAMSKQLRQSHELERLRQEKSKYWQIISISLSLAGSLVALIAQKTRNQYAVLKRMDDFEAKLLDIEKLEQSNVDESSRNLQNLQNISVQLNTLNSKLDLALVPKGAKSSIARSKSDNNSPGWTSYVPGLSWIKYYLWY